MGTYSTNTGSRDVISLSIPLRALRGGIDEEDEAMLIYDVVGDAALAQSLRNEDLANISVCVTTAALTKLTHLPGAHD